MLPAQVGLAFLAVGLLLRPSGPPKARESDGPDAILARFELYRDQHGDFGRIDAERRLVASRAEYQRRRSSSGRAAPLGIGGTHWVSIGPSNGAGRMTAVAPHPTRTGTVYAGAAGGGVWKTEDSGATWSPLTEDLSDLSVGALAIAPSSPDTIYLGTGEGGFGRFIPGIGFLSSRDGGTTWNLPQSVIARSFFRICVHPTRPEELVAGTENGGARSTDGGRNWSFVIPERQYGAVTEVLRSPADPSILYAATWCGLGCTAGASRVLKSTDGGVTWTPKSAGLPVAVEDPFLERFSLAIDRSSPQVLYVATSLSEGGFPVSHVYKSVDGGESWSDLESVWNSPDENVPFFMGQQSWYDNVVVVSPSSPETVIAGGVLAIRSTDGGASWSANLDADFHVDQHDFQYQGSTLWVANDGGIFTSADDGASYVGRNSGLVTRQYYALGNDLAHRNRVVAGSQDNGTGQRTDAGGTLWRDILGADGFDCASSPLAPNLLYATIQRGRLFRSRDAGAESVAFRGISPPYDADEEGPFRTVFALDPTTPTTIYTGTWRVWRSRDAGDNWVPTPAASGGSPWPRTEISALALAPSAPGTVWVAKGGTVFRSGDSGQTWRAAGAGLPGSRINGLEADPRDPLVAYAALATTTGVSVYRTSDGGARWEPRSGGLPRFAAMVVRVDPTDPNILFCGTDVGVYRSTDQGGSWVRFGTGLPAVSVHDLRISEDASIVRVATHGRGAWELEVPAPENRPPVAALVAPGGSATVALGSTVAFASRVTDEDAGDSLTGVWTFPDTWETLETRGGDATVRHAFRRTGVFPVSLTARDTAGATATTFVTITVAEAADDCRRPVILPGAGPFPVTVLVNNEAATLQASDPVPDCLSFEGAGAFGSVWLEFTPVSTGFYDVTTCGTSADTVLTAFTGPVCGPYVPVANGCDDDVGPGDDCARTASRTTVYAETGQALRIQLTGFFEGDVATIPVTVRPSSGASAPQVTGIDARLGSAAGGTALLLSGANFAAGATVLFGGASTGDVQVLSPTLLSATAPPHAAGVVDIVVENTDGSSGRLLAAFTYLEAAPLGPCGEGGADCPERHPRAVPPRQ